MRHLDLFSGIGGFALAATWVWGDEYENVGHSEIEKYPCKVYHNHFVESECLGDITKIDWSRFSGTIDIVTGGFPCQPHSVAGKRKGSSDERDLWSECVRAIRELRPRFALFENVPGIFSSNGGQFFERVLSDISASGYDAEWQVLSAAEVGAWHKRERVWITCFPNAEQVGRGTRASETIRQESQESIGQNIDNICCEIPDSRLWRDDMRTERDWRTVEPRICRVGDELSKRLDKIALTNATPLVKSASYQIALESLENNEQDKELLLQNLRRACAEIGYAPKSLSEIEEIWRSMSDEEKDWFALRVATRNPFHSEWAGTPRIAKSIPSRADRLKALGNAIVPKCAAAIMGRIKIQMDNRE